MIPMTLVMREPAWPEIDKKKIVHLGQGAPAIQVAVLDRGMESGRPSIALRIDLPDGQHVIAETSARLFVTAARAIHAKYPDLFEGD